MTYNSTSFMRALARLENLHYELKWQRSHGYPRETVKHERVCRLIRLLDAKISVLSSFIIFRELDLDSARGVNCIRGEQRYED